VNDFELRGRQRKVSALVVQLITEDRTPDEVTRWHADRWCRLAIRAGTNPPSFLTMADVIDQLERRARTHRAA
jgi:adenine deaminase